MFFLLKDSSPFSSFILNYQDSIGHDYKIDAHTTPSGRRLQTFGEVETITTCHYKEDGKLSTFTYCPILGYYCDYTL